MKVRPYASADLDAVVRVWHVTKQDCYPYLALEQGRTLQQDHAFFVERILPRCDLWIAEQDGAAVGFLALSGSYIDRLYILPGQQRRGAGSALIDKARLLSPDGLELHTHQKNVEACAFYQKLGFRAVKYGVSPAPESEPE